MTTDPARSRWIALQLIRLTGVAVTLVGILAIAGRIGIPPVAGYVIAVIGLVDAMVVPLLLARRWKSPPP